jgi:hypothetical protein
MTTTTLTVNPGVFPGTADDDTVNGTPSTLTRGISLMAGVAMTPCPYLEPVVFNLSSLDQFTGFEQVDVTNLFGQKNLPSDLHHFYLASSGVIYLE